MRNKILELKKKSELTWKDLAKEIGVEPATLHLWKNGFYKQIRPENQAELDRAFDTYGVK